jgi:NADPH:quinone reductase-like Zn-dependent oxidoreductase
VFGSVLGADGVGKIVDIKDGGSSKFKIGDRVVINPSTGWIKDPRGPEEAYYILGGGHASGTHAPHFSHAESVIIGSHGPDWMVIPFFSKCSLGVFSDYYVAPLEEIFKAPDHLTDAEAAALPLGGLTAYRAVFTKGQVAQDQNVLITGIGTVTLACSSTFF